MCIISVAGSDTTDSTERPRHDGVWNADNSTQTATKSFGTQTTSFENIVEKVSAMQHNIMAMCKCFLKCHVLYVAVHRNKCILPTSTALYET